MFDFVSVYEVGLNFERHFRVGLLGVFPSSFHRLNMRARVTQLAVFIPFCITFVAL